MAGTGDRKSNGPGGAVVSISVLTKVWEQYPGNGGSELLALLALADWSDDDGRCFPSMEKIALKTRLSRSQAQRVIHGLIDSGYLAVTENVNGGRPGASRRYRIVLSKMTGRADATPTGSTGATGSAHATGRTHAQEGSHPCAETGRADATLTVIEPSITVKSARPHRKAGELTFIEWTTQLKASSEKAISTWQPIWDYADSVGIGHALIDLAWLKFRDRYTSDPNYSGKKQKDWRAVFKSAVSGNWFKLWFLSDDGYQLTTVGQQATREFQEVAA